MCLKLPDGSVFRDRSGLAWVNPYRQEVWDYLVEIGTEAAAMGFDEVQFDYIRFCTERGVGDVVFDEAETRGRSQDGRDHRIYGLRNDRLSPQGIYVAADVFGAIIGSEIDSMSVGQVYEDMAAHLDYICPMIYPSHYGDGNFGIEHPDTEPYRTILAALQKSSGVLGAARQEGQHQAIVRPWLQDFTASYLKHYIEYGPEEIRAQIQATYDAGYDEWMLWSAAMQLHLGRAEDQGGGPGGAGGHRPVRAAAEAEAAAQSEAEAAAQSGEAAAPARKQRRRPSRRRRRRPSREKKRPSRGRRQPSRKQKRRPAGRRSSPAGGGGAGTPGNPGAGAGSGESADSAGPHFSGGDTAGFPGSAATVIPQMQID